MAIRLKLPAPALHPLFALDLQGRDFVRVSRQVSTWSGELGKNKPEPQVVVAVARLVPVAIGRPAVPGVVVPAAATVHPVRTLGRNPKAFYYIFSETFSIRHPGKFYQRFRVTGNQKEFSPCCTNSRCTAKTLLERMKRLRSASASSWFFIEITKNLNWIGIVINHDS